MKIGLQNCTSQSYSNIFLFTLNKLFLGLLHHPAGNYMSRVLKTKTDRNTECIQSNSTFSCNILKCFCSQFPTFAIQGSKDVKEQSPNFTTKGSFIQYVCKIFRKTNISYPPINTENRILNLEIIKNCAVSQRFY